MNNGLGDLVACTAGQLAGTVRNRLRHIQHRPGLISGFLAQPGLTLEPEPPWRPDLGLSTSVAMAFLNGVNEGPASASAAAWHIPRDLWPESL